MQKIGIKTPDGWRQGKCGRIADRFAIFAEAQENPHGLCPQPVGGLKRKGGRLAAAQDQFPDMIV